MLNIERIIMAEGGSTPEAGGQEVSQVAGEPKVLVSPELTGTQRPLGILKRMFNRQRETVLVKPGEQQVFSNASLADQERLQAAQESLGTNLIPQQQKAILKAHEIGSGEPGTGIFKYTPAQLRQKTEILKEAGFTTEQRRQLLESGIAGVLPPTEFTKPLFDPNAYAADPTLQRIAQEILASANAGMADGELFKNNVARLQRLADDGRITDQTLAEQLRLNLERWRIDAETRGLPRRLEQRQGLPLDFDNLLSRIDQLDRLQRQSPSPQQAIDLAAAIQERELRLEEANTQNLLLDVKSDLFETYYEARVEVTRRQKLGGTDEVGRPGKLRELDSKRQDATLNSWEARQRFWADPTRQALEARFGGVADYFYRRSLDMIRTVVNDRHATLAPEMESLRQLWDYTWTGENNIAHEMRNFDDVRERVETERKKRYFVPNRGDYESWIQLVADDIDEFNESIPHVLDYIRTKFQSNDPNKVYSTVEQEQDKIIKAVDKYALDQGYEIGSLEYRKVRRTKSELSNKINLLGAEEFAKVVYEDWTGYNKFMSTVLRGFRDTETQDHFVDAILLDDEGMVLLALDQLEVNDGEYWRYGKNTAATPKTLQIGEGQGWQAFRREEIVNFLVNHELRPINDLLQNHPAFQRLKVEFDQLDQEDITATAQPGQPGYIRDADGKRTTQTRWQEYIEKALEWGRNHTIGDPRDKRQRVLFQHPRARALTDAESIQMYQQIQSPQQQLGESNEDFARRQRAFERGQEQKRERMRAVLETALRNATAFQEDVQAGGPRHNLTQAQKQELGLPLDDEAISHNRLLRVLLQRAINADAAKPPKRQMFKLTHILRKMGLDRVLPLFSNWRLGVHDDIRPGVMVNGIQREPELMDLLEEQAKVRELDPDDYLAGDAKTAIGRWVEAERRFWEMMEVFAREEYPRYFNFPGHDTEGGGNKEMRNLLFVYGQSWGTAELSSLVRHMWLGEQPFLPAFGCSTWQQFVGLVKGGNEIVFKRMGGLFESPRDAVNWGDRIEAMVAESKALTSGGERGGHGLLNDGWGSGFFKWRALNRAAKFIATEKGNIAGTKVPADIYATIIEPDIAYHNLDQKTYEAYINLAAQFCAPLIALFDARFKLENVFGRNPGTAMFLNTLTWDSVSQWMDRNWEEYRGKFGNALDVNLHMARKFIRTFLYENRYIYYDNQWDQWMLGYTIPQEDWDRIKNTDWSSMTEEEKKKFRPVKKIIRYGVDANGRTLSYYKDKEDQYGIIEFDGGIIKGETFEGILDAFPKQWRGKIIARHNQTDEPWIIPMGLNTEYPETLGVIKQLAKFEEYPPMRKIYEFLLKPDQINKQTRPRKKIRRD